jgi:hypothetical protein
MRYQFFFLTLGIVWSTFGYSQNKISLSSAFEHQIRKELEVFYSPSQGQIEDLLKGEVISVGKVDSSKEEQQELMLFVAGVHPRNCHRAMRKLAYYENYHQYMDFIKQSRYDDGKKEVFFVMDHALLPFPMHLNFKIPRIQGAGHYPFTFEHGFLKDLKGTVGVQNLGKFCLLSLKADWQGPKTKIPNLAFSMFLQTVGKIGLEHLIRVSIF